MKQDEIIEMARQAGMEFHSSKGLIRIGSAVFTGDDTTNQVVAFAKLVAAKEREAITDEYWSCVLSDLEHGVKSLNEEASRLFHISMPEVSKFGGWLEARGEA